MPRDLLGLPGRSLIGPDDGRREGLVVLTQENGPVHLPGEADSGDSGRSGPPCRLLHGGTDRLPPGLRVLLGPTRSGSEDRVLGAAGATNTTVSVDNDGLDRRRAEIDSQKGFSHFSSHAPTLQ